MPINIKKEDLQNTLDNPKEGYVFLSFDPTGRLVTKDSTGYYAPVVPIVSTGNFVDLTVGQLTVGYRYLDRTIGSNSIGQGVNIIASGISSYAQGNEVTAQGDYSRASGEFTLASGKYSYASGKGYNGNNPLTAQGLNSFVHSYSTVSSFTGTRAFYSVILGGINHNIGSGSDNSVILGGTTNIINGGIQNVAIIACNTLTATISDAVYVPRLILKSGSYTTPINGTIEWDGSIFRGYKSGSWQTFGNVSSFGTPVNDQVAVWTDNSTIEGSSLTYTSGVLGIDNGITFSSGGAKTIKITSATTVNTLNIIGQTNSLGGPGGDVSIKGGPGASPGNPGGDVLISGGDAYDGGDVYIYGGEGYSNGDIYIGFKGPGLTNPRGTIYAQLPSTLSTTYHVAWTGNASNGYFSYIADTASDIKYKTDLVIISNAIDKINQITGYTYRWNNLASEVGQYNTGKTYSGVIAQDVELVFNVVVDTLEVPGTITNDTYKKVEYDKLIPLLIEGIKEQQVIINSLEQRIYNLENPS